MLEAGLLFRRLAKITLAIDRKFAKNACFSGVLASVVPASLLKLFLSAALAEIPIGSRDP